MDYNYMNAIKEDVLQAIRERYTQDELHKALEDRYTFEEELHDELWIDDKVTGNASGSYTFNRIRAREYVLGDMDAVENAMAELCVEDSEIGKRFLSEDWEWFDVVTRCALLGAAISDALDELEEE